MFYSLYKHQGNTKPFLFNVFFCCCCERRDVLCSQGNGDLSPCEDIMFSRKAHLVFHVRLYIKKKVQFLSAVETKRFFLPAHG